MSERTCDENAALTSENARLRARVEELEENDCKVEDVASGLRAALKHEVDCENDLHAENARLRGEVETYKQWSAGADHTIDEQVERIDGLESDVARVRENAMLHASRNVVLEAKCAALTADLARVTGERDGLRDCVQAFADTRPCGESVRGCLATWPDNPAGWCDGCRARSAIAACAPPASGEGGYPYAPCPKCGQQAAHEGPVCAGCFTKLTLAARPAPAKEQK
jgi:hypothetical protein